MMRPYEEDLISALATPAGVGALSVLRVSGKGAVSLFCDLFKIGQLEFRHTYFKVLKDSQNNFIDEVITYVFEDGKSFTGEESFEIICHGSPLMVSKILECLGNKGVRLAEPGEFSYRAYLNGKIDLSKAEGLHHTIHAENEMAQTISLNLLSGRFRTHLLKIKDHLVLALSRLEALIDFSDEDIETEHNTWILDHVKKAEQEIFKLIESHKVGAVQAKGVGVVLCGPPNAGKSSLFNRLISEDRSIVSEEAGTTRDYIESFGALKGNPLSYVDTAGLRVSSQGVEQEGIKRTWEKIKSSQLILFVVSKDTEKEAQNYFEEVIKKSKGIKVLVIDNKQDLGLWSFKASDFEHIEVSNKDEKTISDLEEKIYNELKPYFETQSNLFLDRHKSLFKNAYVNLKKVVNFTSVNGREEIISSFLYNAISFVDEVLFINDPEAVRDQIFKDFCLGK